MSKKKLVFRVGTYPTKSETFITNQIILAIDLGFEVTIFTDDKHKLSDSSQPELLLRYGLLDKTKELKRIKVKGRLKRLGKILSISLKGMPIWGYQTFNYFKYGKQGLTGNLFFQLFEIKDFLDADLFHIQFGVNKYPLDNLLKYKLIKGKLLTTFHGYDVHFTAGTKAIMQARYNNLFSVGDIFTSNTKYLAAMLFELGCPKDRLQVIPMSIDTDYFVPLSKGKEKGRVNLISVGRLIKLKGYEYGIRAVAKLIDKGYNLTYHILGEGVERDNLQKLIRQLGIENYVFLQGAKTQGEIRKSMQTSDIFLMTSTYDETGRREAQGVVTGEAQACGIPVVAFNSGGVSYTIDADRSGFLSKENDYKDMANNIERLIVDEELRKIMSENARKFIVANYSQNYLNTQWKDLYFDLLSSKTNPVHKERTLK